MDFIPPAALLRRWIGLPLLIGLLAGGGGFVLASQVTPVYRATATVMIQPGTGAANPATFLSLDQLARTYAQLMTRRPLLDQVIGDLALTLPAAQLAREISIVPERDTALLDVQVDDQQAARAARIANALVKDFIEQARQQQAAAVDDNLKGLQGRVKDLEGQLATTGQSIARLQALTNPSPEQRAQLSLLQQTQAALSATYASLVRDYEDARTAQLRQYDNLAMVDPAMEPTRAFLPSASFDAFLASLAGILVGIGLAWLTQRFDTTLRSPADVRRMFRIPLLASLPSVPGRRAPALVALRGPEVAAAEAFRILRNTVLFTAAGKAKTLAITSALPREGKTWTAANLAAIMAMAGHRVVLVDADLRRPGLHQLFRLPDRPGLADALLAGELQPGHIRQTEVAGLRLVTSGSPISNASEGLGSPLFKWIVEQLSADADFVILDTAPVNGIADASVVVGCVSMTLLILEAGRTRRAAVEDALTSLERAGGSIAGVVLNRWTGHAEAYYDQVVRPAPVALRVHDRRAAA